MRRRWWGWAALAVLVGSAGWGQPYQPGLNAVYVTFDPDRPDEPLDPVCRVDPYPWFYLVYSDLTVGPYVMKAPSTFPWPAEVLKRHRPDRFGVVWDGYLYTQQAGRYEFELLAHNLAVVRIDERPVVSHTRGFYATTRRGYVLSPPSTGELELAPGLHQLRVVLVSYASTPGIFLRWRLPGAQAFSGIPLNCLVHDPATEVDANAPGEMVNGARLVGSGSGFIVQPNGWIVTCHHVVTSGDQISVWYQQKEWPATVFATDAANDLAVLKVNGQNLPSVAMGTSDKLKRQDEVYCFGYPLADMLGFDLSTENGRITAIREAEGRRLIQTNAPVKAGNSGGPMVNARGEAIGVVSARLELEGAPQGVAFAVPIESSWPMLRRIPGFTVIPTVDHELKPEEVDQRVSGAVVPILVRRARR